MFRWFLRTHLFTKNSLKDVVKSLLFDVCFTRLGTDFTVTRRAFEHVFLVTTTQSLVHHLLNPRLLHLSCVFNQLLAARFT